MNERSAYNPRDHLVKIKTKTGMVDYYPAAWRLYELNLRYEDANFQSSILHLDVEHNLVVVKCCLYLGPDYATATRKTEAMKSGLLSCLDKVETAAKARCARDLGCGTEYALEFDEADLLETAPLPDTAAQESPQVPPESHIPTVATLQASFVKLYQVKREDRASRWAKFKGHVLQTQVADEALCAAQLDLLHEHLRTAWGQQQANGHSRKEVS